MIQLLLHIYIYINKHLYHRQPKQFRTLPQNSCFDKQREYIFFKMRFMIKFQTELEKQNFTSMIAFEKKKSIRIKQKNYNRNKISISDFLKVITMIITTTIFSKICTKKKKEFSALD